MLIISHVDEGVESMWIGLMTQEDKSVLEERMEGLNQQMSVLDERLSQITDIMSSLKAEQEKGIQICKEEIRNEGVKRVEGNEHILSVLQQGNEFVQTNMDEVMRGLHLLGNMLTEHRKYADAKRCHKDIGGERDSHFPCRSAERGQHSMSHGVEAKSGGYFGPT